MTRTSSLFIAVMLLATACTSPRQTPEKQSTNKTEIVKTWDVNPSFDPLKSDQSPRLIPFSKASSLWQPPIVSYPQSAKEQGIQGDVLVEVWISTEGAVTKAVAVWGPSELRSYAVSYCRKWKFNPYVQDNKPIPVRFIVRMGCRLNTGTPYQHAPKEYFN